jgi:hypothetical protein
MTDTKDDVTLAPPVDTSAPVAPTKNVLIRFLDWALTDNWRDCWKWLSMYGYGAVIASPEIFQLFMDLVAQFDGQQADALVLPAAFTKFLRTIGTIGLIVRMVRQSKKAIDDAAATVAAAAAAKNQEPTGS